MIKAIAAVDAHGGLGYKGELLFHEPQDLAHFKELTKGHFVVMGRKTFESLPVKPLPDRVNIVLSRDKNYTPLPNRNDVQVYQDVKQIVDLYLQTGEQDRSIWVIGGAEIYKLFAPYVEELHLTEIKAVAENKDVTFPITHYQHLTLQSEVSTVSETGRTLVYAKYTK